MIDIEEHKDRIRGETNRFLLALENTMVELVDLSRRVEEDATRYDVSTYENFREELQNFRSLSILVEDRLSEIAGETKTERLQNQFDRLQALMLSTFIRTCLKTFFVYSTKTIMSLGSKERFLKDLVFLKEAEIRLRHPQYQPYLDDSILEDMEITQEILQEIIEKAPGIMEFS